MVMVMLSIEVKMVLMAIMIIMAVMINWVIKVLMFIMVIIVIMAKFESARECTINYWRIEKLFGINKMVI